MKRQNRKRGKRRPKHLRRQHKNVDEVLSELNCLISDNVSIPNVYKQARVLLITLPKQSKKELLLKIKPSLPSSDDVLIQKYQVIVDLLQSVLHKNCADVKQNIKKKTRPEFYMIYMTIIYIMAPFHLSDPGLQETGGSNAQSALQNIHIK